MLYSKSTFDSIAKRIEETPDDFGLYNALFQICKESKDDYELLTEYGSILKSLLSAGVANKLNISPSLRKLFREQLLLEAQSLRFDSYMQYIEIDREPQKRFWLPRRRILMPLCNAIQDLIDDKLNLLTISLPPGTGKSTLEIFLHSMLLGHDPSAPLLATGHSEKLASHIFVGVLDILNNPEYRWHDIYPNAGKVITDAKDLTIDINIKHTFSSLTCRAIGGSLTGATRCKQLLTADDLVSGFEEAVSYDRMEKLWDLVTDNLRSRRLNDCKELYLATRWSVHDPIGRLQSLYENDPKAKFIVMPALNEKGETNFEYDYGVGFSTNYFLDIKNSKNDEASFLALYQNEPIEREGLLYKKDELRRFFEVPDGQPDAIISVCDTKDKGEDYCVHIVGCLYGNDWYITDVVCSNALPGAVESYIVIQLMENNVQMSRFESNSAGGRVAEKIQKEIKDRGGRTKITTKFSSSNKETRIIVNSQWVIDNCLFAVKPKLGSDYNRFMTALCSYTIKGRQKHDDVPDAMAMFADFAQSLSGQKAKTFKRTF